MTPTVLGWYRRMRVFDDDVILASGGDDVDVDLPLPTSAENFGN